MLGKNSGRPQRAPGTQAVIEIDPARIKGLTMSYTQRFILTFTKRVNSSTGLGVLVTISFYLTFFCG